MKLSMRRGSAWHLLFVALAVLVTVFLGACPKKPSGLESPPPPGVPPTTSSNAAAETGNAAMANAEPSYGETANAETGKAATGKTDSGAAGKTPRTAADPAHMTALEMKHVPQFSLPASMKQGQAASITVEVGKTAHPMKADHWIQWIELYADGKLVGKVTLKPGDKPKASFEVTLTGTQKLRAVINCNVHGLWENTTEAKPS